MNLRQIKELFSFKRKSMDEDIKQSEALMAEEELQKPIVIRSAFQYRKALSEGKEDFDFSQWTLDGDDIRGLDLENFGLNINLRDIFVPYGGRMLMGSTTLTPLYSRGDNFIDLRNSNLKGNNVCGGLEDFFSEYNGYCSFLYGEDTFDEEYMKAYPEFFLDKDAPEKLKDKYYNPAIKYGKNYDGEIYCFQDLTFSEYLENYHFLNGKYLDRFNMDVMDRALIDMSEILGLERTCEIINRVSESGIPLEVFLDGVDDIETVEDLQEKFSNEKDSSEFTELIGSMIDNTIQRQHILNRPFQVSSNDGENAS